MGQCKTAGCNASTPYPGTSGWCTWHFYFNYRGLRFYLAIIGTFLVEELLSSIGWLDELAIWTLLSGEFFKATGYLPFRILQLALILLAPILTYVLFSKQIYYKTKIE